MEFVQNPVRKHECVDKILKLYVAGWGHSNLTSMWSASERDAVFHIRKAIEETVRSHVTVERGRIYNEKELEDIFPKPAVP